MYAHFANFPSQSPQLEVLDVRGILFVENYMPVLARALRCGSVLRILHMENCNISGRNLLILGELRLSGGVVRDGIGVSYLTLQLYFE